MYQDDDNDFQPNLESWVINKCDQWRDHYETNYSEKFDEYYRIWRGIWDKSDSMRDSERSRIISPATQQAVESAVAEVEEATFGRGKFFDIRDDAQDVRKEDIQLIRAQLEEDMHFTKARSNIAECILNSAVFGTGIGELVMDEVTEYVPATRQSPEAGVEVIGTEKRDRFVVKLDPVMPQNFLIDPIATDIEDAVGVAIDQMVSYHQVQQNIDNGIYLDVDVPKSSYDPDLLDASKDLSIYDQDMVRLTKYYGLVPKALFKSAIAALEIDAKAREYEEGQEEEEVEVTLTSSFENEEEEEENTDSYVEVIMVIAAGGTILKLEENPYMMKDRPVVAFSWDRVPGRFWGRGICEKAYNSQKALDTELRARIDALALTVHPMMAVDASRMPRGAKLDIRPGKTILTNGNPAEILNPFNFGQVSQITFNQAAELQKMVQTSTGAVDAAGIPGSINGEATAAGISMSLGAIIKRHKRTLINFQENFLIPFVKKSACRYMQYSPELYPAQDFKFVATSSLGIIAREYEVTQLVQLLQTMSPDSPMYPMLVESIVDNMGLANREEIIASMRQASQPNPEQQEAQQMAQQLQMASAQAQLENVKAQTAEIVSRIEQNQVETQLLPIEEETRRISAMAKNMPVDEFQRLVEIAKLELKQKEIESREDIVQMQMAKK
mgnify:CR=1 FL=1|tara:strand:- start:1463 stop:3469 length:2007 start_codon:yes stop_codon:yes gene_type:complete